LTWLFCFLKYYFLIRDAASDIHPRVAGWTRSTTSENRRGHMSQVVIENPVINSPYVEPIRHFRFGDEGITNDLVEGRRSSSYFVPIAQPREKGVKQSFNETKCLQERIQEDKLVVAQLTQAPCTATLMQLKHPACGQAFGLLPNCDSADRQLSGDRCFRQPGPSELARAFATPLFHLYSR
jgi:hypothetical protein